MNTFKLAVIEETAIRRGLARAWRGGIAMSKIPSVETMGTCPKCGVLLNLTVEVTPEEVVYHGVCPEHGAFVRSEPRADLSELGVKVSSTVGIRGQQASVA